MSSLATERMSLRDIIPTHDYRSDGISPLDLLEATKEEKEDKVYISVAPTQLNINFVITLQVIPFCGDNSFDAGCKDVKINRALSKSFSNNSEGYGWYFILKTHNNYSGSRRRGRG